MSQAHQHHARSWRASWLLAGLLVLAGLLSPACGGRKGGGIRLTGLAITPPSPSLALGFGQDLVATGTYSDMTTRDLTAQVTWSSGNPAVATVDNTAGSRGRLGTVSVGSALIAVTDPATGIAASTQVTVTAAVLVELSITPSASAVPAGFSRQFAATGRFSDDTTRDLTAAVTWTSANPAVATVGNAPGAHGLVGGVGAGATTITAVHAPTAVQTSAALTVTPAVLVSIAVTPPAASVALGYGRQFTATGTFSDGTTLDLTAAVTWTSSAAAVAAIGNAPGTQGLATSAASGTTTIAATDAGTGISGSTTFTVTPAALVSIAVTPPAASLALGYDLQFTATGTFSDHTTQDITTAVTWSSASPAAATVSNANGTRGLATSAAEGSTTITATAPGTGISGSTALEVMPAVLVSVDVTPAMPSVALGYGQQFTATGTFSDRTTQDLTAAVTWTSSATAVATISNAGGSQGLATSAAVGTATITATDAATGIAGATAFGVTPAVLVAIAVTPALPSLALGHEQQFTATGTFSDNTTQDITTAVTWSSSSPGTATVSNAGGTQGLATGAAAGTTAITATDAGTGIAGATTLSVTPAVLVAIDVTPALPSLALGYEQQFTATGTFSDQTTQDLTAAVTWTSSATAVATISNAGGTQGLATSAAAGTTAITATDAGTGIAGATTLTVTPAVLVAIAVTPALPSLALGYEQQFTATGTFSDNTTRDLTAAVTWSSSAPATATISNAGGTQGLAASAAAGTTAISATDAGTGIAGATTLTVTPAVLASIAVTPAAASVALGYGQQFTATGTFSDGSTQDLTAAVTWGSSNPATATISNAGGSQGLATSAAAGTTAISATDAGANITGTTTLTVTPAVLASIAVTPALPSVALGNDQQFTATGTFSDGSTQDLTAAVTWASSDPATATVSNASGSEGLASTAAVGSTTITATDPASGIGGATSLTVTAAVLVAIQVTPADATVAIGYDQQFTATGAYSDGSTQDLTASVVWSSSNTAVATISNASGSEGLASSVAQGSTTIAATHAASALTGSTSLTVGDPIVYRGGSPARRGNNVLSLPVAVPAGTVAGDVMLAAIAVRATNTTSPTITAPAGWTLIRLSVNASGGASSLAVYRRVATAGEPASHTWTFTASAGSAGGILTFQGVDTANVVDAEGAQATPSSLSHDAPSVTTATANTMLVTFHAMASRANWTPPAGMTEALDVASGAVPGSSGVCLSANWQFLPAAGSTGPRTATASNNADTGNACSVALRD